MHTNIKKRNEGFTIIEVMIVLAIAGLILLVVFLAVPALQRNSRNTQRKNDVSAVLAAVNEWTSNNQGKLPTTATQHTEAIGNAELGYYEGEGTGQGQIDFAATSATLGTDAADDRVVIVTGSKCVDGDAVAGSARQVAVLYQAETSGTPQVVCQQS